MSLISCIRVALVCAPFCGLSVPDFNMSMGPEVHSPPRAHAEGRRKHEWGPKRASVERPNLHTRDIKILIIITFIFNRAFYWPTETMNDQRGSWRSERQ